MKRFKTESQKFSTENETWKKNNWCVRYFGLETCITKPIAQKICSKVAQRLIHLSSKFQVSTFSRFEVIVEFIVKVKFIPQSNTPVIV